MRKVDMAGMQSGQNSHSHEGHGRRRERKSAYFALVSWGKQLGPGPWKPSDLFAACSTQEQEFERVSGKEFSKSLDRFYLFDFPLFSDKPGNFGNAGYPFHFAIARPEGAKGSKAAWRYTELLRYLRKLDEPELRWLLIARWLDEEGVCEPEEFLPTGVLQRMVKRESKERMRVSRRDFYHWRLIKVWLSYFEALLTDLRNAPKNYQRRRVEALLIQGYRLDAIESALGKHSAVQATTSWLEEREGKDARKGMTARTLENAYSRVEVAIQKAVSDLQTQQSDSNPL